MYSVHINQLFGNKLYRRERFLIHSNEPHINSQASFILLKKYYEKQSFPYSSNNLKKGWRVWLTFRNRFLRKVLKKEGCLICAYCGLQNLDRNVNNPNSYGREATIDHVHPISKGGNKFDESNLVVSCLSCNSKKSNKILD